MGRGEKFFEEFFQGFSKILGPLIPVVEHKLVAHRTGAALKFAVGFAHTFRRKVHVMLKQGLALTALVNGKSNAQHEQTTEKRIQYSHAFNMRMAPTHIKREHALC